MYLKLAIGNVRKSFKDYSIYFLTLTLGVCIFYAFNSIGDQKAFSEMASSKAQYIELLQQLISGVSIFISFILGGLILYANNFLVKKRKKELGVYMTLGMKKSNIAKILTYETAVVGILSLAVGLVVGIGLSQIISLFAAKLFTVSLSQYKFLLSTEAIIKTVVYFGIIFVLVMIFNSVVISKYKLIDMLTASRKSENIKVKSPILNGIIFIISAVLLVIAYRFVIKAGLNPSDLKFKLSIVFGVVATLGIFFSLAGFVLNLVQKNKNVYLKGLNIFTLRQINSKINTNFISMTVISLMLFLTIGTLSTGLSFKNALEKGLEKTTPYGATVTSFTDRDGSIPSISKNLKKAGLNLGSNDKQVTFNEYYLDGTPSIDIVGKYIQDGTVKKSLEENKIPAMAITETSYNQLRNLQGKEAIKLENGKVLVSSEKKEIIDALEKASNEKIKINGKDYSIQNKDVINENFESSGMESNILTLIVPDDVVKNIKPSTEIMNINFGDKADEAKAQKIFTAIRDGKIKNVDFVNGMTRTEIYDQNNGMTSTVLFIGIYLGIIFLITSTAVLALQQLSEASDSLERYKSLRRIGVSESMINKAIFKQVSIYFGLPLIVALMHSVVAIKVVNDFLSLFNKPDIGMSSLLTVVIMIVVYGGYFVATYVGYRSTVKNGIK
ncbi:ABC transporter permease [Clostridium sp. LY3-2]|uniref:FtsX-like permease family protein n=1 Tax=Clostridium sp. LY3-2 TaxID=2942482 RepID=UPI002152D875|nr:ABC transporter permease [Clostridium sp. LY3-2]MCR6514313.1 ABC transporter permease [Clostridium sp. LY3-2]